MSLGVPASHDAVLVRADEAEAVGEPPSVIRLLTDASATGGALSTVRVSLGTGADGAVPHHHKTASEMFYVLDGRLQVLAGEQVLTLGAGDVAAVPPHMAHAFAAAPGSTADLLIVIAPGVERFDYFRMLAKVRTGEFTRQDVLDSQERFDNHFLDSPVWTQARG